MALTISESDYKLFRQLQTIALERFCERVLSEIDRLASDTRKTNHERYLAIYKRIHKRDQELGDAFNNPRRSTALMQLACIRNLKLLTEEEMSRFSPETCGALQILGGAW